ncbi:hypothetical protein E2N92_03305 [Methanofollis formosanus]|uniref:Nucleotide-binding protein n=1 Tax=Methanofollis formosanus TaxID=299308 RepID=A0A8G1EF50_9EURY|nr:OB-fold nucleic acid binding domain-containing protein [Methanofollis formosanus]QYZ78523.1 hypothetical protein E2N92_03305 [Methanofollis formosanus]
MHFHYALVDDLINREEFEQRVQKRVHDSGGLLDENAAALLVVGDCGRQHLRIADIRPGPSLFSFFGRVLRVGEPEEFSRADGDLGVRATLLLGDATGRVEVVLWDEKAGAVEEVEEGEVLEVIGRLSGRSGWSLSAMALRKSSVSIECPLDTERSCTSPVGTGDLVVRVLAIEDQKTFSRRDGSVGTMVPAMIGDETGTARLVCWETEMLARIAPGDSVRIVGARPGGRGRDAGTEFSLGDGGSIERVATEVAVRFTRAEEVRPGQTISVAGKVTAVQPPHGFTTRNGERSWVRNLEIADDSGTIKLVLWGDQALADLSQGDEVTVYHARAQEGRYGGVEVSVGRGSLLVLPQARENEVSFEGTVVPSPLGTTLDNGHETFLLSCDLLPGQEVRVDGVLKGRLITPFAIEPAGISRSSLEHRLENISEQIAKVPRI